MIFPGARKGFTLIELLVVIAIIGTLSTVVISSTREAKARGTDSKINSTARQYINALELYNTDHGGYPYDANHAPNQNAPDVNGDGVINILDLLEIITNWGDCPGLIPGCMGDISNDGYVNVTDLLILIDAWGWFNPVCLGVGNINQYCLFYYTVQNIFYEYHPTEITPINSALAPYISGPPASNDVVNGKRSNGQTYQLRGMVYGCMQPNGAGTFCDNYYLMWFQKYNENCAGGLALTIHPDDVIFCVYSNTPGMFTHL